MLNLEQLEKLSVQNITRSDFCGQLLDELVDATGASCAIIWDCSKQPYQAAVQKPQDIKTSLDLTQTAHNQILDRVLEQQKGMLLRPEQTGNQNATSKLLLTPIASGRREVLEMVVPLSEETSDEQLMKALEDISLLAARQAEAAASRKPKSISMQQFSEYIHAVHQSLNSNETNSSIANESRRLLDCDRVCVVTKQRGRFRLAAISGQPSVNRRSNTVQLLEKLADRVLRMKTQFWYPTDAELPPQLNKVLEAYLIDNATRSLVIQPVFEKKDKLIEDPESNDSKHNPVIGGLIFEHCNEQWEQSAIEPALNFVSEHASGALRNTKKHTGLFLYPVWNLLGKSRVLTAPRVLPKTLLATAAVILVTAFLLLYRVPYYVSSAGVLVPQHRNWIFAGQDGEIEQLFVNHGDTVTKDQKLLSLQQKELEFQLAETSGRIKVLIERKTMVENRRFLSTGGESAEEASQNSLKSIDAEINALEQKSELLELLKTNSTITSPISGQVVTWDVEQKLLGRSVRADQQLLEIADIDGPWILELEVADRAAGELLKAIKNGNEEKLRVSFSLAADPGTSYEGQLVEVGNAIQFSKENTQILQARVELADDMVPVRQVKTGVTAKIYCGHKTSIGYLWLHDIKNAYHRYVSFYFTD